MNAFTDRHGRERWYFRRNGWSIPLPDPSTKEFNAAYEAAKKKSEMSKESPVITAKRGTLDYAKELYYASAEFNNLASSSRRRMRYVLDALCNRKGSSGVRYGEGSIARIKRSDVFKWRDEMAGRPGAANMLVSVLSMWFNFCVNRDLRSDNPARGIKPLKIGEIRDWTNDELLRFEEKWPLGTLERTGYALALYTAQRRSDLVKAKWADIEDDGIWVTQNKTGTRIWIPLHPELQRALDANPRIGRGKTILCGARGHALNPIYFGHIMAKAIDVAGLSEECVLHGLRKTSARIVAEVGGKVGSITGHLSSAMERLYSRRADQRNNAVVAIDAWAKRLKKAASDA